MKMNISTQEKIAPSKQTINFIKQIAYTYRMFKQKGKNESYSIN